MVLEQEVLRRKSLFPTLPGEVIVWTNEPDVLKELQQEHGNLFVGEYSSGRPVINKELPSTCSAESKQWSSQPPGMFHHSSLFVHQQ